MRSLFSIWQQMRKAGDRTAAYVADVCKRYPRTTATAGGFLFFVAIVFYLTVYRAPSEFVTGKVIRIEEGVTVTQAAGYLEQEGVVRSAFWLRIFTELRSDGRGVIAGEYYFPRKERLGSVARKLARGDYGLEPLRVTIPEGASIHDIASIMAQYSSAFDTEKFIRLADGREGYLFPDTYFFLPNVSERKVVNTLAETFVQKINELAGEIEAFGRPLDEVMTMASILEREAYTMESRRIIAGILWKRLELGMPLQVDATFDYINGKNTFELTQEDLQIDSPYNTYRYRGLPPTPIANPGLDAILAAVTPEESEYLYFLSDRRGNVHYSETFEEHKSKKALYLN